MRNLYGLLILLFIFSIPSFGQPHFPDKGQLYVDTIVPRVDILIHPDTLAWLYEQENLESDVEFHAVFIFDNGTVRDTIDPVGFRLRGNTSRYSQKKSFKVSFNTFTKGEKYYGVEKLNLNGEHNDPSIMRSKISWDLMRKWEIPAPRSNHVEVYINNEYYGLYINVEHIDEEFVLNRFGYNDGNLYKCLWPADLNYLGDDPDLYKMEQGDRRTYELKTNKEADDYSDLAHFIDILNNVPDEDFYCKLEEVFNVSDYLKVIVMDIFSGNWDGYIYNKNNFYVYRNTTTDKFEYIPYDLDNTLGIDWFGIDWGTRNIYSWGSENEYRPLYERLMNTTESRDQYTYYSKQLNLLIDFDSLKSEVLARRDMIFPSVTDDPYYPRDYGFTSQDFLDSFEEAWGDHVKYGILPFFQTRISSTIEQLENTSMNPVIKYISHHRSSTSELWVRSYAEVKTNPAQVELRFTLEGENSQMNTMYDDGNHNDGEAGDLIYGGLIDNIPENISLNYQIVAVDAASNSSVLPCEPVFIHSSGGDTPLLYINEFMASNETTIADEYGDFDDWIEVFNAETETVWLGDKYLTDNLTSPNKWAMPDAYIEPGEFLIIWADGEPEQGPFHADFKLSKDGEEIGLFNVNFETIDEYIFDGQETDISEGRFPDTDDNWIFFEYPTPGVSNELTSVNETYSEIVMVFPNPSKGGIVTLSKPSNFKIFNSQGIIIEEYNFSHFFNTSEYNNGLYIVVMESGQTIKLIVQ